MSTVWKKRLLKLGIIVPISLNGVATVDALTRSEFNPIRHWISHQSLGERGWLGTWNLLLSGTLILVFSIVLKLTLESGKSAVWGSIFMGTFGLGLLIAALFPIDPGLNWPPGLPASRSVSGQIHDIGGALVFGSLIAVCLVLSSKFKESSDWIRWRVYSILSALVVFASFVLCSIFVALDFSNVMPSAPSGLFERISMAVGCLWIVLLTLRLLGNKESTN
ncbi:DUF998 domain-containing protein [Paenibacillus sp. URB8-2]|uniref:DUF998 domain-containing protein n=1 Tax=Paenibacillus sp. URB8-2 TaxID=2741301 RepID=UPI0015BA2A78|nr:DUF998 domain-containing protein [Paenibacillus sp. URB8-2]